MHSFSPPTFTNRVVYTLASLPQEQKRHTTGDLYRDAWHKVPTRAIGLQAHNHWGGLISYFNADRGGQAYAYKPELP